MSDVRLGGLVIERRSPYDAAIDGEALPIVFVHGLGGTSTSFEPLVRSLSTRTVIRPDLPGSGRSMTRAGVNDIAGLSRAVDEAMRRVGIDRAHLVGHSLGTLVVRELARRHPERVASQLLFGALTEPSDGARRALRERATVARRDGLAGIATAIADGSVAADAHPAARAFVRESVLRQTPASYAALCELLAAASTIDDRGFAGALTLVTGEDDRVAPTAMATELADARGDAVVVRLSGVGHWPMIEAPDACANALHEHLARAALTGDA